MGDWDCCVSWPSWSRVGCSPTGRRAASGSPLVRSKASLAHDHRHPVLRGNAGPPVPGLDGQFVVSTAMEATYPGPFDRPRPTTPAARKVLGDVLEPDLGLERVDGRPGRVPGHGMRRRPLDGRVRSTSPGMWACGPWKGLWKCPARWEHVQPRDNTARKLKTDDRQKLRAEAEARFARAPRPESPNQPSAALLHELQVHQIELEMQNEELRRNQLELEKARDRQVDLYDFAPVGYVTLDENGDVRDANLTAAGLLGRDRKSLVGRPFVSFVRGTDADGWHRFVRTLARTGEVATYRLALTRGDGAFDALLACEQREGGPTGAQVRVVLTDVTELAQSEKALRESEHWLRMSQRVTRVGHYLFDVGEDHWTSSPTLDSIFGIDESFPRKGSDWLRVVHPDDRASMEVYLADLLARGAQFDQEYRVVDQASGEVRWVHGLGELQRNPGGEPIRLVGTIQDITKRKRLEEERNAAQAQLALAARLAAMGTLVTGVAHEINNPLAAAIADEEMALSVAKELLDAVGGDGPFDRENASKQLREMVEALTDAQEGGRRIAQIVRDLAVFGRPDQKRTLVRLIDVVRDVDALATRLVGRAAKVDVQDGGAPDVLVSFGQMEQVVVNLVTNAAKATKAGEVGSIIIRVMPGAPGMARLEVIDRGVGMEPSMLERVFEPFFTNSAIGQGMGLGLSICKVIVTAHGGTLTVESKVGKGSTFRVELPAAPAEA